MRRHYSRSSNAAKRCSCACICTWFARPVSRRRLLCCTVQLVLKLPSHQVLCTRPTRTQAHPKPTIKPCWANPADNFVSHSLREPVLITSACMNFSAKLWRTQPLPLVLQQAHARKSLYPCVMTFFFSLYGIGSRYRKIQIATVLAARSRRIDLDAAAVSDLWFSPDRRVERPRLLSIRSF
jgi:hypothetical protein